MSSLSIQDSNTRFGELILFIDVYVFLYTTVQRFGSVRIMQQGCIIDRNSL